MAKRKGKKNPNPRHKGNRFELAVGKLFREWAMPAFKEDEDPTAFFKRSPNSGAWDRRHCPGEDLITPPWWPFAMEMKNREGWDFSPTLRGEGPIWTWWDETHAKVKLPVLLIFTRNYEKEWLLMDWVRYTQLPKKRGLINKMTILIPERGYFTLMPLTSFFERVDPILIRETEELNGRTSTDSDGE